MKTKQYISATTATWTSVLRELSFEIYYVERYSYPAHPKFNLLGIVIGLEPVIAAFKEDYLSYYRKDNT